MTVFLNERRRLSFYGVRGHAFPWIFFFQFLLPLVTFSGFLSQLSVRILAIFSLGKYFSWKIYSSMKSLTDFRSRHFVLWYSVSRKLRSQKDRKNDVWGTTAAIPYWWRITTQIWVVLLIGRAAGEICLNQSETQPRSG